MPAVVRTDPLAVVFTFSDGAIFRLRLDDLPCPELVADLAVGLAGLAHPHDRVNRRRTAEKYRCALKNMAVFFDSAGFSEGAAELSRGRLVEFWLGTTRPVESTTRRMLSRWDEETGGLRDEVREYLQGQLLHAAKLRREKKPLPPYTDAEWERLRACCLKVIDTAEARRRAALATIADSDASSMEWSQNSVLRVLAQNGPMSPEGARKHLGDGAHLTATHCSKWWSEASAVLFPSVWEALAYRLLFGMATGIVPDGLANLGLSDIEWAGDSTIVLDYVKGRTGPESAVLPRAGVRVLQRWLEHSALLRAFAPEHVRQYLWLTHNPSQSRYFFLARFNGNTVQRWVANHGLVGDDGTALKIHRHRIRTTFQSRRDKNAWTGRITIDPNHTAAVEGDHYLSRPTPAQQDALDTVIEQAQSDCCAKPPRRWC